MPRSKSSIEKYFKNQLEAAIGEDTRPLVRARAACFAPCNGPLSIALGGGAGVCALGGWTIGFLPLIMLIAILIGVGAALVIGVGILCGLAGGSDADCGDCDSGCFDFDCCEDSEDEDCNGCCIISPAVKCGTNCGKASLNLCTYGCGLFWAAACCVPCCIGFKNTEFYCIKQQKQSEAKIEELPDEVVQAKIDEAKAVESSEKETELKEIVVHIPKSGKDIITRLSPPSQVKINDGEFVPEGSYVRAKSNLKVG